MPKTLPPATGTCGWLDVNPATGNRTLTPPIGGKGNL